MVTHMALNKYIQCKKVPIHPDYPCRYVGDAP